MKTADLQQRLMDSTEIPDGLLFYRSTDPADQQSEWQHYVARKYAERAAEIVAAEPPARQPLVISVSLTLPTAVSLPAPVLTECVDYERIAKIIETAIRTHRQPLRVGSEELLRLLDISDSTLERWMKDRTIPYEQVPTGKKSDRGKLLFDLAAVDKALKKWRRNAVGD